MKDLKLIENGWIKLYRNLKNKGFYKKSEHVHLWIHLLMKANHAYVMYPTAFHSDDVWKEYIDYKKAKPPL